MKCEGYRGVSLKGYPMAFLRLCGLLFLLSILTLPPLYASQVPRIDKDRLQAILDSPDLILLDVRPTAQWAASSRKLPGAKHRDPYAAEKWGTKLDRNKMVVTYCA